MKRGLTRKPAAVNRAVPITPRNLLLRSIRVSYEVGLRTSDFFPTFSDVLRYRRTSVFSDFGLLQGDAA